jgi:hypothetical protein
MMEKLGFLWIDALTIELDSCGPCSNEMVILVNFIKYI